MGIASVPSRGRTYRHSASAVVTEVDGRFVALNIDRGVCYGLNTVASRVWTLLDSPASLDLLVRELTASFDVDADTCRAEVYDLLRDLEAAELVVVSD